MAKAFAPTNESVPREVPAESDRGARPRILHILNSRHFNGAEAVAATIMAGLAERWETLFVSRPGPVEEAIVSRGLNYRSVESLSPGAIRQVVRDFGPDLVHAHDYRASLAVAATDVPMVSHLHNNYPWAQRLGPATLAYRLALHRIDRVIAVSPTVIEEHRFRRAIAQKGTVVENGLDLNEIRRRAHEPSPQVDLLFVGRMTDQKDPLAFIRIVEGVRRAGLPATAAMLGSGELVGECRTAIAVAGLENAIDLRGYVANPYPAMAATKVCIVPSRWEGFGLVAAEGMALERPVLGRPVGGLEKILMSVATELVCRTEEEFVDRAVSLLSDPDRRRTLGQMGAHMVAERYAATNFLRQIEDIYLEVLGTSPV